MTAAHLHEMSQGCVRAETLQAANTRLVASLRRVPLSTVWGDGPVSSSEGQRFGLQARSLLGSLSPRYGGYDDRAGTVYTPMADPHRVLHTQVSAGARREAT
jgi:TnpA family transposase